MRRHKQRWHAEETPSSDKSEDDSEEEEEDSNEEDNEEEETNDLDSAWKYIFARTLMSRCLPGIKTVDEILSDKALLKTFCNLLGILIFSWREALDTLDIECDNYSKIKKTADKLVDQEDYDPKEAFKKAFKDRRSLIVQLMRQHEDVIQSALDQNQASDEDMEEDTEEGNAKPKLPVIL